MSSKLGLLLFILSTLISNKILAQNIEGEWYTPLRNKLLCVTISKDSISLRKCSFEGEFRSNEASFKVEKRIGSSYIASQVKDSVLIYSLLGFKTKKNRRIYLNIKSMNQAYPNMEEAEKAIVEMENQAIFITFLTKREVKVISKKKNISKMTAADFKKYALKIIEEDKHNSKPLSVKYKLSYLYVESTLRIMLADFGYNCLASGRNVDDMLEKFSENPETKEIFLEMIKNNK